MARRVLAGPPHVIRARTESDPTRRVFRTLGVRRTVHGSNSVCLQRSRAGLDEMMDEGVKTPRDRGARVVTAVAGVPKLGAPQARREGHEQR